ncbi:MAG: Brp/Blh family beta-carotene 15,15'-dioxygenase [Ferruginibacter sp.]
MKILFNSNLKTEGLLLIIGCIVLGLHYFIIPINPKTQMIVLLSLVFLVGVPHGALDFLVDEQNKVALKQEFSIKKFVSLYLFRLFAFGLVWIFPWVAFSIFLLFSIYHFGETDMAGMLKTKKKAAILYIAYGSFILGVLLLVHLPQIKDTLPVIKEFVESSNLYANFEANRYLVIMGLGFLFVVAIIYQKSMDNIVVTLPQLIRLIILLAIISLLPLLMAFAFYFALWHSILSVRNIFSYFKSFNNNKKFTVICNKSILFSLLALGGMVMLYFILSYFLPDMNILFALLIVLSVLTLPHLQVMHRMYQNSIVKDESVPALGNI